VRSGFKRGADCRDALHVTDSIRHLRLVEGDDAAGEQDDAGREHSDAVRDEVCATRRSVARFLRALQVSGHPISGWPGPLVSRLAHADAVTARFLSEPERVDVDAVHVACVSLQAVVKAMVAGLNHHERARLRSYELAIRVGADELAAPLVQPDRAPEDDAPAACEDALLRPTSLRTGLAELDDPSLAAIARRLGLGRRFGTVTAMGGSPQIRERLEREVSAVLRDDHLLGILIATLPREALDLLGALVRDSLDDEELALALVATEYAAAVGEGPRATPPAAQLEQCGLAFRGGAHGRRLWAPVELCHRLDGVLRALGV